MSSARPIKQESNNVKKWLKWFETIEREVTLLVRNRHVYREVTGIVRENETARQASSFHDIFSEGYVASAVLRVRRLGSRRKNDVSMSNLLTKIEACNCEISLERHLRMMTENNSCEENWKRELNVKRAINNFEHLCGSGHKILSKATVNKDITKLKQAIEVIENYANERIAHIKDDDVEVPTYENLDESIDGLEELTIRYGLLLKGSMPQPTLLPTWQYNWKQIFSQAWLPNNENVD